MARKRKHGLADETLRRLRDGVATPAGGTPGTARKISGGKTHRCYASCGLCQLRSSRAKRLSGGRDVTRAARARDGPRRRGQCAVVPLATSRDALRRRAAILTPTEINPSADGRVNQIAVHLMLQTKRSSPLSLFIKWKKRNVSKYL